MKTSLHSNSLRLGNKSAETSGSGPASSDRSNLLPVASIAAFLIAIFEMIFMGGPFAAYFYGVYSPFLSWTQSSSYLMWLSDFFVTHLSTPRSPVFGVLSQAPKYLLHVGLTSFVVHAVYLYWMKFVKKEVATRLLYKYVRHPQYLSFAVAGIGLIFHWPRFINLILFFVMLLGYYALARSEEARMERIHGQAYVTYKQNTAMFLPGRLGEKMLRVLFSWLPQTSLRPYAALAVLFVISVIGGFALRRSSVCNLHYEVFPGAPRSLVVFLREPGTDELAAIRTHIARLSEALPAKRGSFSIFYVLSGKAELRHLLVDSGVSYDGLAYDTPPDASLYLVQGVASYPCPGTSCQIMKDPTEPLRTSALRKLEHVYYVARKNPVRELRSLELPSNAFYRHSSMPIL
ncbi:MAG: methyltransferase family protein [Terriglobia bacterium]